MSIDPRLQRLLDKDEIGELLLSFVAALDGKDWQAYGDTFAENGEFTIMGQKRIGRAEIVAGPERDLARFGIVQHFSANQRIEVRGDEATASHYLIAVHGLDAADPSTHTDVGGRYDCRCVRTPEGWKFAEVVLTVFWTAGAQLEIVAERDA